MTWGRRAAAYGGGGLVGAGVGMAGLLAIQARLARHWIGQTEGNPPVCNGEYGTTFGNGPRPLRIGLIGDSSAAGLGVELADQTPGALIAQAITDATGRPVLLRSNAFVGAQSSHLAAQLDELLAAPIDLVVAMVGANDVTHRVLPAESARYLEAAVLRVRAVGARVVVGTCPDLGTIRPIPHPLRLLCRHWSRSLASAQAQAVARAGGVAVYLGQVLGPEFDARPLELFGDDGFHPSASGYRAAVGVLLPDVLLGLGVDQITAGRAGQAMLNPITRVTDADEDPVATRR